MIAVSDKKVSVIVPVYNVEKYINKCVDSVLSQTYSNIEVILVDDESPDNCPEICDLYKEQDKRVKVIHKKNGGLGFARNSGLAEASGDYVLFVDSDDYIDPNMIKRLYDKLKETGSDTVFCGLSRSYKDGSVEKVPAYYDNKTFSGETVINNVLLEMIGSKPEEKEDAILYMSVWHALYSMDIIKKYGIKFPSEREFMSEDIAFHIDYLRYSKQVSYIADCLYYYRVNDLSLSMTYDPNRFNRRKKLYTQICEKLSFFLEEERYLLRAQRMFLGGVRGRIIDIVRYEDKKKTEKISEVTSDDMVQKVLFTYPYNKNPIKHKLYNFMIKYKLNLLLCVVTKMFLIIKK